MVFHGHEFELFFIELDFRQEFIIFLFLQFLVLIHVLVLAFETVVFLDQFFVAFLELFVLIVDVLDLGYFLLYLSEFGLNVLILMCEFVIL